MITDWLPGVSAVLIVAARAKELLTCRQTIPGRVRETWTLRLFLAAGALMLLGGLMEPWVKGSARAWNWGVFTAGWLCAGASFALRRWAIASLGRFWSLHVEIRETHAFVRAGPFRWVRHPTYSSMLLELIALSALLAAPMALCASLVVFVPTLLARIHLEERALEEKFGETYRTYRRSTPALLPRLAFRR